MAIRGRRRTVVILALVIALVALLAVVLIVRSPAPVAREDLRVAGISERDGQPVEIDAAVFLPEGGIPAPAVLLAHGFGGDKEALTTQAERLAREGFVVATYTARGFGGSGGRIHLNSPDFEVGDAARVLDALAQRPDVQQDGPGDPRVAVVGASYGGALALLLAGTDERVDSIIPMITWHSLQEALFPQSAAHSETLATPAGYDPTAATGVFKRLWSGSLFSGAVPDPGEPGATPGSGCGRFDPQLCAGYAAAARDGVLTPAMRSALAASSPASVLDQVRAPTLLVQGQADSLFPLWHADENAAGIAATGTPVRSVWVTGGHDGGFDPGDDRLAPLVLGWLDQTLRGGPPGEYGFEADVPRSVRTRGDRDRGTTIVTAPQLPGTADVVSPTATDVALAGEPALITSPAGGTPAAMTTIPGLDALAAGAGAALDQAATFTPPGQSALFESEPVGPMRIVGAPRARLTVRSSADDAVLFASLQVVTANGQASLPQRLVSPIRVRDIPPAGRTVDIALPAVVRDVPAGARLRLVVTSTDAGYALPIDPRIYTVGLAESGVTVPLAPGPAQGGGIITSNSGVPIGTIAAGAAVAAALVLAVVLTVRSRRRGGQPADPSVPVAVIGLGKSYGDGYRAVEDLSFTVGPGQILGLLGPNGAGKTTTLRMLLGLIRPSEGEIRVFGEHIEPGAAVLHRVGALVEGPGLLPHISGLGNLRAAWQATGRREEEARFDIALQIAGLGSDVHRKVRTYSHGMRQRLAIAQAMLGLPDLLVLDEPTNGLDPPQIAEMRQVLRSYADTGRTVVLSSHLLAEVEATCTHLVVMARGRLVAHGPVADVVGSAAAVTVDVSEPQRAAAVARALPGTAEVHVTPTGLVLRLPDASRAELVRALVAAGLEVDRVAPQHSLEDAFLALVEPTLPTPDAMSEPAGLGSRT